MKYFKRDLFDKDSLTLCHNRNYGVNTPKKFWTLNLKNQMRYISFTFTQKHGFLFCDINFYEELSYKNKDSLIEFVKNLIKDGNYKREESFYKNQETFDLDLFEIKL